MTDRIEKQIKLNAPVSRVWRALTDHREFGEWFRVKISTPFQVGQTSHGKITYPGYEHLDWRVVIQKMEPERLFSFTWHPYAVEPDKDYSTEPPTLVEFRLKEDNDATILTVTESGFDKIPKDRASLAWRMNDEGWSIQMKNIDAYVSKK